MDDLQFQLEEQGIISGDKLETATESNEHRLVDISIELERERESNTRLREELEVWFIGSIHVLYMCMCVH